MSLFKNLISVIVLFVLLFSIQPAFSASSSSYTNYTSVEKQKKKVANKIKELKRKEKIEITKLSKNQQILEKTKQDLTKSKLELSTTKHKLNKLESNLNVAVSKYNRTESDTAKRIRKIYKGESLNVLHLLFDSDSVNELIDTIYFQNKLSAKDARLISRMKQRTINLAYLKQQVEGEKRNLAIAVNHISRKKKRIDNSISNSQYLINKLKTDRATWEKAQKDFEKQSSKIEGMIKNTSVVTQTDSDVSSTFLRPIAGRISSPFGWRRHPIFKTRKFHTGVDIAGRSWGAIRASNSGKVIHSGWYGGYGKVVILDHGVVKGKKTTTLYAHMAKTKVRRGQRVQKGDTLGYEGMTGYSTGPHLHFEVRLNGKPTNPLTYVRR